MHLYIIVIILFTRHHNTTTVQSFNVIKKDISSAKTCVFSELIPLMIKQKTINMSDVLQISYDINPCNLNLIDVTPSSEPLFQEIAYKKS